jgi:DNA uptake protein ComE-like DNA-binding protein
MKVLCFYSLVLLAVAGCSPARRSPDAIRQDAARATSEAAKDAKAVVQGVADGLREKGPLNINQASVDELESLPGIDSVAAGKIVDGRPYDNSIELVQKHIVTKAEYNRIANKIEAN